MLMILLGFAWFLFTLDAANSPLVYTFALVTGGLWGALFLHLGLSFPTGRLRSRLDRALVIAGYVLFPLAFAPALLFADPEQLGCGDCPENLLLIRSDDALAAFFTAFGALLYVVLFLVVLARAIELWRRTGPFERLQLTPVYVCSLLTFLLVTVARAGAGDAAYWAAFIATGLMPLAFLGGLLRSHVSHLDAELQPAHGGAAGVARAARDGRRRGAAAARARPPRRRPGAPRRARAAAADGAHARAARTTSWPGCSTAPRRSSRPSLGELRELARGIHPAVLTERGLEPALQSLVARAPVPVTVEARSEERLPGPVESAAYFVVSEALANVAKYARATHATVMVERANGHVTIEVADDGVGGADAGNGSGLRGLEDRLAALDGTLWLESPVGQGTRLRAKIPVG